MPPSSSCLRRRSSGPASGPEPRQLGLSAWKLPSVPTVAAGTSPLPSSDSCCRCCSGRWGPLPGREDGATCHSHLHHLRHPGTYRVDRDGGGEGGPLRALDHARRVDDRDRRHCALVCTAGASEAGRGIRRRNRAALTGTTTAASITRARGHSQEGLSSASTDQRALSLDLGSDDAQRLD